MKSLQLSKIICMKDVVPFDEEVFLSAHIGYDEKLYILRQTKAPEPLKNQIASFPNPHADSDYTVYVVDVDWENGGIIKTELITLEHTDCNFSFVKPLGENIIVVGARCFYNRDEQKGEDNAFVFDCNGKLLYKMCLGDGISRILTFSDHRIVTGYFDEGVFGNYGWDNPIGSSGIVVWDQHGNVLWENPDEDIDDIYDMSYGTDGSFWYYAYMDFDLINVSKTYQKTIFRTDTKGCYYMIPDQEKDLVMFDGGYDDREHLFTGKLLSDRVSKKEEVRFLFNNDVVSVSWIENTPERMIIFDKNANIYTLST